MTPELPQELDRINLLIQKLRQAENLLNFEAIDIPFELSKVNAHIWELIFSPEVLQQIATSEPETLDAWAIALTQALETQLGVLNNWLPLLTSSPIPSRLNQKINNTIQAIGQIAKEKSHLLNTSANLLSQEEKLRHDQEELNHLQKKVDELKTIEVQLQQNNLEILQQQIARKSKQLEPEAQVLSSLQQKKAELEAQISALKQQQDWLNSELARLEFQQHRGETSIANAGQALITLTQTQREKLSQTTATILTDLEKQREEYNQIWQQLQSAIQAFNQYQTATDEIRINLETHYYSDQAIAQRLPMNCQQVDSLIHTIQENLAELDRQLADARRKHEQSQQKQHITF